MAWSESLRNLYMGDECVEAVKALYEYLDGELTVERRIAIKQHLDFCPPCDERFEFESELRVVIAQKCRDQVPDHVRQRVLDAIEKLSP